MVSSYIFYSGLLIGILIGYVQADYCSYFDRNHGYTGIDCPRPYDNENEVHCCGSITRKYCCNKGQNTIGALPVILLSMIGTLGVIGTVIGIVICCCVPCCPLYQRRHRTKVADQKTNPAKAKTTMFPEVYPDSYPETSKIEQAPPCYDSSSQSGENTVVFVAPPQYTEK